MIRNTDRLLRGVESMCKKMDSGDENCQFDGLACANSCLIVGVDLHDSHAILKLNVLRAASIGIVICEGLRTGELYLGRLEHDSVSEKCQG